MPFSVGQHVAVRSGGGAWFGYVKKALDGSKYEVCVGGTGKYEDGTGPEEMIETVQEARMMLASAHVAEVNELELNLFRHALRGAIGAKPYAAVALVNQFLFRGGTISAATYDRSGFCPCHQTGEALQEIFGAGGNTKLGNRNAAGSLEAFRAIMQAVSTRLRNDATLVVWIFLDQHSITLVKTARDKPVELFETWAGDGSDGFDFHENLYHTYLPGAHADYWAQALVDACSDDPRKRIAAGGRLTVYSRGYEAFAPAGKDEIVKLEVNMQPLSSQEAILAEVREAVSGIAGIADLYAKMQEMQGKLYAYGTINQRRVCRQPPYDH